MTESQSNVFPENLQTIDEVKAALDRKPYYQLIAIGGGLANCAALLHVAYKSASFEAEDYGDEIFNKSIGNGGDAFLIQKIMDQVAIINESVMALRLQLAEGEES